MEHNKFMRQYSKDKYANNKKYKAYMLQKGRIRNQAVKILTEKYKTEFQAILKKLGKGAK